MLINVNIGDQDRVIILTDIDKHEQRVALAVATVVKHPYFPTGIFMICLCSY